MPSEMFSVATIRSEQPAITALPAKQRPATTAIRGTRPESPRPEGEGAGVEGGDDGVVGVAGAAATALGEEDGGQAHALDQLEQPVLLAVAEGALGAGEDGVVVGEDGAGAALAEELAVDPGRAGDQAVGGGAGDQVLDLASPSLGGDRETAVLDEGARIDQVGEVLARRASAAGVAALDRVAARLVTGLRLPAQHLGEVRALLAVAAIPLGHRAMFPDGRPAAALCKAALECSPLAV